MRDRRASSSTPRSDGPSDGATQRFGAALSALFDELDWPLLGRCYCEGGGDTFFDGAAREALLDSSLHFAADVSELVATLPGNSSLYVGAALAELAPMLAEALLHGRRVVALSLAGDETTELNRAVESVAACLDLTLPRIGTTPLAELEDASFDHGWFVSVASDPEAFPGLHDELYAGSAVEPTGRGDAVADRARALGLIASFLRKLGPDSRFHTTDVELVLFSEAARRLDRALEASQRGRVSSIVGDIVRRCHLREP